LRNVVAFATEVERSATKEAFMRYPGLKHLRLSLIHWNEYLIHQVMLGFKEWYQALYRAKSCQFVPTTWFPPFAFYRTPGFGVASRKAAAKATRRPGRKYQPWSSCSSSVRRFPCASRSTRRRAVPSRAELCGRRTPSSASQFRPLELPRIPCCAASFHVAPRKR
jgi:hypothetical protein